MNNTEHRASPKKIDKDMMHPRIIIHVGHLPCASSLTIDSSVRSLNTSKNKAGKRLSHIRFSPYRGRLATREDSRAHPRGLPHSGKNAAKLAIIADKAQLFYTISFKNGKNVHCGGFS